MPQKRSIRRGGSSPRRSPVALLTQSAIRAEFLHGLYLFIAGLFVCVAFMTLCLYWRRERERFVCFVAAFFGFGIMVLSIPSVVAPEMVLARVILARM